MSDEQAIQWWIDRAVAAERDSDDLRAQLASAESQLRLAFFPFRLQARPAEGGDWTDIYPAQLQAFTKGPYDVRAIELPLTDE